MSEKKVLIVDDDPVIRNMLERLLHSRGYTALTAVDGSQAVSIARHEKPDLILLDMLYPPDVGCGGGIAWDGFLIIDWLRRLEEAKDIPVYVMTKASAAEYRNRAFAKGAAAFFQKPIDNDALLATIRKTLGEPASEPEEPEQMNLPPGWTYLPP